jgi:hypothetical protein
MKRRSFYVVYFRPAPQWREGSAVRERGFYVTAAHEADILAGPFASEREAMRAANHSQ